MGLISDGLLIAAALVAAIYCHVLAGRLRRLRQMDGGVGQAVAAMAAQTEELRLALRAARAAAGESTRTLAERTARAEMAAGRLELLLAAIHDREGGAAPVDAAGVAARREAREAAAFAARARNRGMSVGQGRSVLRARIPDPDPGADHDPPGAASAIQAPFEAPEADAGDLDAEGVGLAGAADAEDAVDANRDAPSSEAADGPPPAGRRLFRIEIDPADEDETAPEVGRVERLAPRPSSAAPAPRARPPRGRGLGDSSDGTETLRAAIEALARESGE